MEVFQRSRATSEPQKHLGNSYFAMKKWQEHAENLLKTPRKLEEHQRKLQKNIKPQDKALENEKTTL